MIKIGRITDVNPKYRAWFLGAFVEEADFNTSDAKRFEANGDTRNKARFIRIKMKLLQIQHVKPS